MVQLPDAIDAADVAQRALADDVLFAPGMYSASRGWKFHALQRRDDGGSQNLPRSPKRNDRMRPDQNQ
jgi:hypothetical protein